MAPKKPPKKPAKTKKKPPAPATTAGDPTAALLAVSTPASAADVKNETIFRCIVTTFDAQGLNHIGNPLARIVWSSIDDAVIVALGDGITNCIIAKGFTCTPLAPAFKNLKNMGQVTVVGDLVSGIAVVVTP